MDIKIQNLWYRLRANFLFLPAVLAASATVLATVTIAVDQAMTFQFGVRHWWLYGGDADGARTILSVISSSMISIAGVVFSITIVVLTLASSQFGPRLVRNFMNIRANQMVLGTFVATFIYGILVLRTVNAVEGEAFVPGLSVSVAFLISLVNLALLIYFIHTVSESIQAQNIIDRVREELDDAVERIFPHTVSLEESGSTDPVRRTYEIPTTCDREACPVEAAHSGYLQAVDETALLRIAVESDLLIHLGHRPGQFVTQEHALVTVWPGHRVDGALSKKINAVFIVGPERTLEQDVEFAISQLVEIAVRALSPGINDPITAITCIDWLGAVLSRLAGRKMPDSHRYDERGRLRVICKTFTFEGMLDEAFNMIRQNSQAHAAVSIRLLETIAKIASRTRNNAIRAALRRHADMVMHGCEARLATDDDRHDLSVRHEAALRALEADTPATS